MKDLRSGQQRTLTGITRGEWCWPTSDRDQSWLYTQPLGAESCTPVVRAFDPVTLKQQWSLDPSFGDFAVGSALERDGALLLALESRPHRADSAHLALAVRVSDGQLLWRSEVRLGRGCVLHYEAGSRSALHVCRSATEARKVDGSLWTAYELASGRVRWQHTFDASAILLAAEGGSLMLEVQNSVPELMRVDLNSSRLLWSRRLDDLTSHPNLAPHLQGVFILGKEFVVQDGGAPARLRAIELGSGSDRFSTLLPHPVDIPASYGQGTTWILVDAVDRACSAPPCPSNRGYRVLDGNTGKVLVNIELPAQSQLLLDRPPALGAHADEIHFERSAPGAVAGYRSMIVTRALSTGRTLWQSLPAQCSKYEQPKVLSDARYVYACECDSTLRVYSHAGKLEGSWGVEGCGAVELRAEGLFVDEQPLTRAHWASPQRRLRVRGQVEFGHESDREAFSGWVQVGERRVRTDPQGVFDTTIKARGWTLVQPLPKTDLGAQVDERRAPPDVSSFDAETVSVGFWH